MKPLKISAFFLLFIGVFAFSSPAFAATILLENQNQATIFTALDGISGGTRQYASQIVTATTTGNLDAIEFYASRNNSGTGGRSIGFDIYEDSEGTDLICSFRADETGTNTFEWNQLLDQSTPTLQSWHLSEMTTGFPCLQDINATQTYRVEISYAVDGAFQDGELYMRGTSASNYYFVGYTGGLPPPAPTTDFNEVVNYIPQLGFSTTTGTTTIGVNFSIAQPDFIEYIGYRILSPSNEILYDASTTASVAGLYTISADYLFSVPGTYQGHAYFAQDIGGNVWEIDNPTIQQILVDVEDWTISPDGQFTQNSATTSTTTLSNLTLDCGTGFTSSVCNLIARVLIPSPASIGLVQSQWSAVLSKAPFSFFTESKNILDAVRGSVGVQQSLSLTLFGQSIDVISTTTAASVGLDTTQINAMKFLMEIGLFILFAWFVYWRVASIFGV